MKKPRPICYGCGRRVNASEDHCFGCGKKVCVDCVIRTTPNGGRHAARVHKIRLAGKVRGLLDPHLGTFE